MVGMIRLDLQEGTCIISVIAIRWTQLLLAMLKQSSVTSQNAEVGICHMAPNIRPKNKPTSNITKPQQTKLQLLPELILLARSTNG